MAYTGTVKADKVNEARVDLYYNRLKNAYLALGNPENEFDSWLEKEVEKVWAEYN